MNLFCTCACLPDPADPVDYMCFFRKNNSVGLCVDSVALIHVMRQLLKRE